MIKKLSLLFLIVILLSSCNKTENQSIDSIKTTDNNTEPSIEIPDDILEFDYDIGFTGVTPTSPSPKSGTNTANNKSNFVLSLVCSDEESGTVYYVNYGQDDYLYSYKDGKSELVLEMPVNYINYIDGDLYFLSNGKDMPDLYMFSPGALYKHNVENKTTELLLDEAITELIVNEKGFFFYIMEEPVRNDDGSTFTPATPYFMSFSDNTPIERGLYSPRFYGEYQLKRSFKDGIFKGFVLNENGNEIIILPPINTFACECIVGDKLYFNNVADKTINSLNLKTGELKIFYSKSEPYMIENGVMTDIIDIADYTVIGEDLFAVTENNYIYKYDEALSIFVPVNEYNPFVDGHKIYKKIFTDGVDLYAIRTETGKEASLNRFYLGENGSWICGDLS